MTRVELLTAEHAPLLAQPFFAGGDPGPIVAALATVPELLGAVLGFVGPALSAGSVGLRAKELAILRTSALQRCTYCVHAHTTVALNAGLTATEVRSLRGESPMDAGFTSEAERALIGWIDALAGAVGPVADETWNAARLHWSEHALVEIAVTVGATMFLNRLATGLQLPAPTDALASLDRERQP
jgi:AhpD family alkylhydroperoxidase